jgi:oligopeptide/dipeptide ABC transporter ATP-binding protein
MYAGEIVERGTVRDIFHHASHPYALKLLECDPGRIAEKTRHLPTIPGDLPDLVDLPQGCIFRPRCPRAIARCAVEAPAECEVASGHWAACHLATEAAR